MARAVPQEIADRRRARLAELMAAIGDVRGYRITQREFSAVTGCEQGTVAAILGGHRALGGDVLGAVVRAWRLPPDALDAETPMDFHRILRACGAAGAQAPRVDASRAVHPATGQRTSRERMEAPIRTATADGLPEELAAALDALRPDKPVAMALTWLARRGTDADQDQWAIMAVAGQAALDLGSLPAWLERTLAEQTARMSARTADGTPPGARIGPRNVVVHPAASVSSKLSRG